ncbi:MAG: ATP-binding protein [Candidatus Glassbacteria bacterium]
MIKIKYNWATISLELVSVITAVTILTINASSYSVLPLLLFIVLLIRARSPLAPFIILFTILLMIWYVRMGRLREEPDLFLWEEMGKRLEKLSKSINYRIAEDEELLMSLSGRIQKMGILEGETKLRSRAFEIMDEAIDGGEGRGVVLFDHNLEWVAWSGKIRGINARMIREVSEDGPKALLQKGAVFTVLTMASPVKNENSATIGILLLSDLIAVDENIEHAALPGEGFVNSIGTKGERWGNLVPGSSQGGGMGAIPIKAFGEKIALIEPPRVSEGREFLHFTDMGRKPLSLILLLPLLYVTFIWLRKLNTVTRSKMSESATPYPWLLVWLATGGILLLALRMALLRMGIPGDFWDTPVFSPNLFASGFLDTGSRTVGDFFISSYFIFMMAFWFLIQVRWLRKTRGRPGQRFFRMPVTVVAFLIPASVPLVFIRLLRDTSGELLIHGRPFESLAFSLWEGSIFILIVAALFVSAGLFVITIGNVRRSLFSLAAILFLLSVGILFYMLILHPGKGLTPIWITAIAVSGVSASSYLALQAGGEGRLALELRTIGILLSGLLFASSIAYPVILRERYRVLIDDAEELFEVADRPIDTWVTFLLEEFIEDIEGRKKQILEELSTRELAFALWVSSPLAGTGMTSSLSVYDDDGTQLSTFSLLAEPLPEELVDFLLEEISGRQESFIYTGFVRGEQYYIAAIPLGEDHPASGMLLARLPTGLKRRIAPGLAPFLRSEGTASPGIGLNVTLVEDERNIPWQLNLSGEESGWVKITDGFPASGSSLASARYIDAEQRWLILRVPLMGVGMILGMMVATLLLNTLFLVPPAALLSSSSSLGRHKQSYGARQSIYATFRARLTIALFVFSLIPTLIWGFLSRGAIIDRMERETRAEAQRILRDARPLLFEDGDSLSTSDFPFPSGERIAELAESIGAELFLYSGNMLVSSSRPDLIQSGIMVPWMDGEAFVELFLEGNSTADDLLEIGSIPYVMVYSKLGSTEDASDFVLATPMLLRQEEIREEVVEFSYSLLIVIMSMLGGSVLMGILVASLLAHPLGELRKATGQIAAGNLEYQLGGRRVDEFGELYESFNEMARRLKTSRLELLSEKSKMESIVRNVGAGVLVLNGRGELQMNNEMASALLGHDLSHFSGSALKDTKLAEESWGEFIHWIADLNASGERQFEIESDTGSLFVRAAKTVARSADEEALYVIIFEDVTEGIRSQRILAWADLARQIAHEIKNPLTPIRLAVQHIRRLFRDRAPDFEERLEENVDLILREIERLGSTASQFSDFAKAERTSPSPVNIAPVIEEVLALYGKDEGNIHYHFTSGMEEINVLSDREDFRKVLVNLLENSRDAMPDGGTISVTVGEQGEWITLTVSDTGEGISSEYIGRIFEPDFTTRTDGTGLGLTIVKRLAEGWGGRVEVESEPNSGTRATIFMKRA